jgi:hypothetical protein
MSSEVHKYIEEALEKNQNLFDANVINFPKEKRNENTKDFKIKSEDVWSISDKSNDDQRRAVMGFCFMVGVLIITGLYSNLF